MRGGKVFDHENEQPAHKGPAIIFSEVLCIEWVWGLIGWSGKNIQILILYDRYYLPFWFFVLLWICIYFSQLQFFYIYFSVFCLLFPHLLNTNFSQQVFFFFTLLQKFLPYSVCTYMCTYIFLEFYQVFPVYFLLKRFLTNTMGFSGGSDSKETTCSAGDLGSISG